MSNPGESDRNGARDLLTLSAAEQRIAELEAENERLNSRLRELQTLYDRDRALLDSYTLDRFPRTEEEFLRLASEGPTFRELLDELMPESRQEPRS